MDLGLYNLKYPARRALGAVLPLFRNVSPNALSWSLLPVGAATAAVFGFADGRPGWLLAGAGLILLRMLLGTLDGLVAVSFERCSPRGELVNRLTPELCDIALLGAIALAAPVPTWLAFAVLGGAWLTSFAGLIGLVADAPIQSVGPVGQTDRLAALIVLAVAGAWAAWAGQPFAVLTVFCWWCVTGGAVTIALRLHRTWKATRAS